MHNYRLSDRVYTAGFSTLFGLMALIMIVDLILNFATESAPRRVTFIAGAVFFAALAARSSRSSTVLADNRGVIVYGLFRTLRVRWQEVERFAVMELNNGPYRKPYRMLAVNTRDGRTRRCGTVTGAKAVAAASALNERLRLDQALSISLTTLKTVRNKALNVNAASDG